MVKLYEELVKLCMVCIAEHNTGCHQRDLNCLSSQDLGGIFYMSLGGTTGKWPGEGNRKGASQLLAWQEEFSLILSKHPIRNYQCTLVGIKNSNDWEISKEKSKLEIGNVHIRKVKFSKEKCTYWKSK